MNTKAKGDVSAATILAALVAQNQTVSVPWGDNAAYDLVLDTGDALLRVQCKTGRLRDGRIVFQTSSVCLTDGKYIKSHYRDKTDLWLFIARRMAKFILFP